MSTKCKTKCGEILYNKSESFLTYCCEFCGEEFRPLATFLKHTVLQHLFITQEELTALLNALKNDINSAAYTDHDHAIVDDKMPSRVQKVMPKPEPRFEDDVITKSEPHEILETGVADNPYKDSLSLNEGNSEECMPDSGSLGKTLAINDDDDDDNPGELNIEFVGIPEEAEDPPAPPKKKRRPVNRSKEFICGVCSKRYTNNSQFRKHEKTHLMAHLCEICGVSVGDISNLKIHMQRHLGIKKFSCNICGKQFVTTPEVKIHMRSHTGEKPYKCNECDKSYTNSSHLAEHKRTHKKERTYVCSTCGKGFFTLNVLRGHEAIHNPKKTYVCDICQATYTSRHSYKAHMRSHSGVKEYKCTLCPKEFVQQSSLYSHMKTHANVSNPNNPPIDHDQMYNFH